MERRICINDVKLTNIIRDRNQQCLVWYTACMVKEAGTDHLKMLLMIILNVSLMQVGSQKPPQFNEFEYSLNKEKDWCR